MTFISMKTNRISRRFKEAVSLLCAAAVATALFLPTQYDYNYPPRPKLEQTTSLFSFVTFHGSYFQKVYLFYTGQVK